MNQILRKQSPARLNLVIFAIAIMLSDNIIAAKPVPEDMAVMHVELDAAIAEVKKKLIPSPKKIGDKYGGGIVFYVNKTRQHGLIAARADQSIDIKWYNGKYRVTGATGDGVGSGATNTTIIVAVQMEDNQAENFAAKVAADYRVQDDGITACTGLVDEICHADWYLPSKHELDLLYQQKDVVGGFATNVYWDEYVRSHYWSSTEVDSNYTWAQNFDHGGQHSINKIGDPSNRSHTLRVRAVRAF